MKNKLKHPNKKGNQMVEAAIVLPLIIIGIMLLLRLFVFYLEMLDLSVKEHEKALQEWEGESKTIIKIYESTKKVSLLKGGLLLFDVEKQINTKAYVFKEDYFVRAGVILDEE